MANYRLDFAYDGTDFSGYAAQPGLRTVQGSLEEALRTILGAVRTHVAGRTDAGVHARHQVVNVETDREVEPGILQRSLNSMLGPEVVVDRLQIAAPGFHARRDATGRTYRYQILTARWPDPFRDRHTWHRHEALDVDRMNAGAAFLVGEHDFASFCRKNPGKSTRRHVRSAYWTPIDEDLLVFEISADSFCHQMVRSIVALSVEIGRGNSGPGDLPAIQKREDRNAARGAAPARGLFLWRVNY